MAATADFRDRVREGVAWNFNSSATGASSP